MANSALVTRLPSCDFCDNVAAYDGKTTAGPWAFMCEPCWKQHGVGQLGVGCGQRLLLRGDSRVDSGTTVLTVGKVLEFKRRTVR